MRLSSLFAKYLYQRKQLQLQGFGVFTIDPSIAITEFSDKNISAFIQQIRFAQKDVDKADEEFIDFIRTQTGKIKPLAESDLESFLSDAKILLNLGKPFHLEGIGFLLKNREGIYEFTAGDRLPDRLVNFEDNQDEKNPDYSEDKPGQGYNIIRRFFIATSIIAGIALAIWGGYALNNRRLNNASPTETVSYRFCCQNRPFKCCRFFQYNKSSCSA